MGVQFRYGPRQVINQLLGVRDRLFTSVRDEVQPTAEVRAVPGRPWEDYDEQVLRWWVWVNIPAVAAQVGVLQLTGLTIAGPGIPGVPPGSLWTIDRVRWSVGAGNIRIACQDSGAWDTPGVQPPGPFWQDQRIGPNAATVPLVLRVGADAAPGGSFVDEYPGGAQDPDLGFVGANGVGAAVPGFAAVENVNFVGAAVNVTQTVSLRGRILLAQQ